MSNPFVYFSHELSPPKLYAGADLEGGPWCPEPPSSQS